MAVDQTTQSLKFLDQATNASVITSSATPSFNSDQYGALKITAQAVAITSVTDTGSPVDGQLLRVRILDNGTNRAITWGAQFEPVGVALPTTTAAGKRLTTTFFYDATTAKWGSIASVVEA